MIRPWSRCGVSSGAATSQGIGSGGALARSRFRWRPGPPSPRSDDDSVIEPPVRLTGEDVDRDRRRASSSAPARGSRCWAHPTGLRSEIGDGTSIVGDCALSAALSIRLGERVLLARNVYIADHMHRYDDIGLAVLDQGITRHRPRRDRRRRLARPERRHRARASGSASARSSARTRSFSATFPTTAWRSERRRRVVRSFGNDERVKTLLFLSYYFPPIGGAGAQRPLKMVRYLERNGYRSRVVTGPGPVADRWAPSDQRSPSRSRSRRRSTASPGPEPLASGAGADAASAG